MEKNAETENFAARRKSCEPESLSEGLGGFQESCRSGRNREGGNATPVHQGKYSTCDSASFDDRESYLKKILERLDKLESNHLEYVNAHQNRLRARLSESEDSKDEFAKEANDIRAAIQQLIALDKYCSNHSP
ncbi:MAG: hypothetical protein F6K61_21470 [Sphaerospermopsis sp. SIO1G1]|nr:hypothetical protein [Sphaerospermopsis sp. SIO1G1]